MSDYTLEEETVASNTLTTVPITADESDYPDISTILQKDTLAQKARKRNHCRENHLESKNQDPTPTLPPVSN